MNQREKEWKDLLNKKTELPEIVREKANQAFRKIEAKEVHQDTPPAFPGKLKPVRIALASAAAVFLFSCLFCISKPVVAKNLPLVGHIFERLQDEVSFFGNFSDAAAPLAEKEVPPSEQAAAATGSAVSSSETAFSQTSDGLTVTLSEIYANEQAIYLTVIMESDAPFPDTLIDQEGKPVLSMTAAASYDFVPSPAEEPSFYRLEGDFLDDQTYSCILRIDLQETAQAEDIPASFCMKLSIPQIFGDKLEPEVWDSGYTEKELAAMSDEQWAAVMAKQDPSWHQIPNEHQNYIFDGDWTFDVPVAIDTSRTQKMEIHDINESGIGIQSVLLTPYELEIFDQYPDPAARGDYFLVALDADGNKLPYNDSDSSTNNFAIQDRDISTVQIFILDYVQYMDELKGEERYSGNEEKPQEEKWETLLKANAKYHTTLHLTKIE